MPSNAYLKIWTTQKTYNIHQKKSLLREGGLIEGEGGLQEVELYIVLAMCEGKKSMKVKLFLYLVGSQGRELYTTMTIKVPGHERNFKVRSKKSCNV